MPLFPKPLFCSIAPQTPEWAWGTFHLRGAPLLTRAVVYVIGEEVTVNDAKARRELGYQGSVSREAGLIEMTSIHDSSHLSLSQ